MLVKCILNVCKLGYEAETRLAVLEKDICLVDFVVARVNKLSQLLDLGSDLRHLLN